MSNRLPPPPPPGVTPQSPQYNQVDSAAIIDYLNGFALECIRAEDEYSIADAIENNTNLYLGKHRRVRARGRYFVLNRIQLVCIGNAAIQASDRPRIKFNQRETSEPPRVYIAAKTQNPMVQQVMQQLGTTHPMAVPSPQNQYPEPLTDEESSAIQQQIALGEMLSNNAMAAGLPEPQNVLPKDFIVEVNDAEETCAAQMAFDIKWEQAELDQVIVENILYNGINGHQNLVYGWDDETRIPIVRNAEQLAVHLDPFRTDIRRCQGALHDEFLGEEEACAAYPAIADQIHANATSTTPVLPGWIPYRVPRRYYASYFYRGVVVVRTAWFRNQPYSLTPEEALKMGKVVQAPAAPPKPEDPNAPVQAIGGVDADKIIEEQKETPAQETKEHATGQEPPDESQTTNADTGGIVGAGAGGVAPAQPMAFYLAKDGVPDFVTGEVTPAHDKWPFRLAIREFKVVANTLVSDKECEFADIPLPHNVNIPIPNTPWGQGEPERLEQLNDAINKTLTDIVENGEFNANSAKVMEEGLFNSNKALASRGFISPGEIFKAKLTAIQQAGGAKNLIANVESSQLPAEAWKRLEILLKLIDSEGNQAEILQGQIPGSQMAAEGIQELQNAARTSILFKSGRTESMLKYLAKLIIVSIVQRMTPQQLADEIRDYPIQVWQELHRRMVQHCLDYDISVQINSGTGASKANQTTALINAKNAQIPVSNQTIMEKMELDPDTELQNIQDWERKVGAAMPQQPQQGAPGQAPPQAPATPPQ